MQVVFATSVLLSRALVVGLPGFEPESIEPKSTSLDQASRQPLLFSLKKLLSDLFIPIGDPNASKVG